MKVKIKEVEVFLQKSKNLLKKTEENLSKIKKDASLLTTND